MRGAHALGDGDTPSYTRCPSARSATTALNSTTPTGAAEYRASGWAASHAATLASLAALAAPHGVDVDDLVPAVRVDPLVGSNVNYLKLQTLALSRFARVLFLDLDVVVVGDLSFLLAQPHELVGYRSCTAPVNSGLFVVRPSRAHLRELMTIARRNGCPRAARGEFARVGYDGYGPIAAEPAVGVRAARPARTPRSCAAQRRRLGGRHGDGRG